MCLVVVALWLSPLPAVSAEDTFTIRNVAVDETAGDTREARLIANRSALQKAWHQLALRLVLGDPSAVTNQDAATLETLVRGLEVDDEKISAGRYQAVMNVRFHAPAAFDILERHDVAFLETPSPMLLVLPVFQTDWSTILWEDGNMWLAAWQQVADSGNVVEIVVPRGDLQDIILVDASDALSREWSDLETLVSRNHADAVLVAHATMRDGMLRQRLTWLDAEDAQPVLISRTAPDAWPSAAFQQAVLDARRSVDEFWSESTLAPEGPRSTVLADIPVDNLAEWIDIRRRLESTPVFHEIVPLVVSMTRVRVRLEYSGKRDDLFFRMRRAGLDSDDHAGILTISRP